MYRDAWNTHKYYYRQRRILLLAFLVIAQKEDQVQNYSKAVNGKQFCHLARHHFVWEGDVMTEF